PTGSDLWLIATGTCLEQTTGNRAGWRLPTVNEIATVFDPSSTTLPPFPPGHPFTGVSNVSALVWTVTESAFSGFHRLVGYDIGRGGPELLLVVSAPDADTHDIWCVRGLTSAAPQ